MSTNDTSQKLRKLEDLFHGSNGRRPGPRKYFRTNKFHFTNHHHRHLCLLVINHTPNVIKIMWQSKQNDEKVIKIKNANIVVEKSKL